MPSADRLHSGGVRASVPTPAVVERSFRRTCLDATPEAACTPSMWSAVGLAAGKERAPRVRLGSGALGALSQRKLEERGGTASIPRLPNQRRGKQRRADRHLALVEGRNLRAPVPATARRR